MNRAETKALIGGGGYSYIRVLPDNEISCHYS